MSKRRFFIIGKGSGSIMRHLTVNVGGGHGSLLVNGELVTLNENNNYEGDFPDGTQIELDTVASTDWQFKGWYDDSEVLFPGGWNYDNPTTIIMNGDYTITAHTIVLHTLEVVVDPSKYTLMVYDNPHTSNYTSVNAVGGCDKLKIVPETGYQFNSWGSAWDNNTTNPDYWCYYNDAVITPDVTAVAPTQPNDEIWYTSSDGNVVTPYNVDFGTGITVTSNTYADGKGIIKLSGNATTIGNNAFKNCTTITSIGIPETVIRIGYNAFEGCTGLTSVIIPDNVMFLTQYAFYNCTGLTSVTIGKGITSIGEYAFFKCSGLISITIPDNVTYIEDGVFDSCTGLTSITCEATTPPTLGTDVFANTNNCPIYVPAASVSAYQRANKWSRYSSRIQAIQP